MGSDVDPHNIPRAGIDDRLSGGLDKGCPRSHPKRQASPHMTHIMSSPSTQEEARPPRSLRKPSQHPLSSGKGCGDPVDARARLCLDIRVQMVLKSEADTLPFLLFLSGSP